ncbi:MAG: heavy-metal-associated domain-containing protein [Crocinitomicaceae bacterium]|jgi:copper chaperone CopZ
MLIQVENLKCGGCVSSVNKALLAIEGVQEVHVDLDSGMIEVNGHAQREQVVTKLVGLGYPELGNNHFISKTKSFVSCAIGKMSD